MKERNPQSAVFELTGGRGADAVIEAVGNVGAYETAMNVVRPGGTVSVVGMYVSETTDMQLGVYWTRMLKLVFSGIAPIHAWWERALHAVQAGKIDPLPIISHTLPLAQAPEGYRMFEAREATKVVLKP